MEKLPSEVLCIIFSAISQKLEQKDKFSGITVRTPLPGFENLTNFLETLKATTYVLK